MKLNIIKLLITTLLFISVAFAFELIVEHLSHVDTTPPAIFPEIKWGNEALSGLQLDGKEMEDIFVLLGTMALICIIILWPKLKK
ncbi:MAG: hypothetical protein ACL7AY_15560 [Candidatus Arsenophonus phytopathogenicus]